MAHVGTTGLQAHSCGPLYPWMIRSIGNDLQAFNGVTGQTGPRRPHGTTTEEFKAAYRKAEGDVPPRILQHYDEYVAERTRHGFEALAYSVWHARIYLPNNEQYE